MEDLPYVNVRSPSPTSENGDGKITGRRRSRKGQWRVAPPLPGARVYGLRASVRIEITPRLNSELWLEVSYSEGRFWVRHDASLLELVQMVQRGGFLVQPHKTNTRTTL